MNAHMRNDSTDFPPVLSLLPALVLLIFAGCVSQTPGAFNVKADHEAISRILDAAVLSSTPAREFEKALPEVRAFASVDSAWTDGTTFFVKYRNGGGPVSWTAPPDSTPQDIH